MHRGPSNECRDIKGYDVVTSLQDGKTQFNKGHDVVTSSVMMSRHGYKVESQESQ